MNYFDELMNILQLAEPMGSKVLNNGVRLIGHLPHIHEEAYLHHVYPPLANEDIDRLETEVQRELPFDIKSFLRKANGIRIFWGSMSINGFRRNYVRTGDESFQPVSMATSNTIERPSDADEPLVLFGFYDWDGSELGMTPYLRTVCRYAARTAEPLNEWSSFDEMLISEAERLSRLFDKHGRKLDEEAPTIPL